MAKNKKSGDDYKELAASIAAGQIGNFYIFHGDERYLLEHSVGELRRILCPGGLDGFNYKRFEGGDVTADGLDDAINTLPAFAERTLVEIHDFDIFKGSDDQKERVFEILSDLPDYVCAVFIYDVVPYKPDGRQKLNAEILKRACVVEFTVQDQTRLIKWITRHFQDAGKTISAADAEYLAFITGGYMSALSGEIEKVAAYAKDKAVTREHIDAVVTPALDAVAYELTDALVRRDFSGAMQTLDELLRMREAPHRLMFGISLKMRQLLAARVCIESGLGTDALMDMCGMKFSFQAKSLMDTARKTTLDNCRDAVLRCAGTAYELNSSPEPEARLTELIARLAFS